MKILFTDLFTDIGIFIWFSDGKLIDRMSHALNSQNPLIKIRP